jgi:transcriptional regulator with XRE-family HTH domain
MNLNQSQAQIVTGVKPGARYARRMADPADDRGEALKWYLRMLIRQQQELGLTQEEIGEKFGGLSKGHVNQILSGKVGVGVPVLITFASGLRETPGAILDTALAWWPVHGKKERAKVLAERAEQAAAAAAEPEEQAPKSGPKGSDRPGRKRAG